MSVYKLRIPGTGGTEDSLASLDVQFDGEIVAIAGTMDADLDADAESCACEVSFLSSNSIATNDARGSLFMMRIRLSETTAASGNVSAVSHSVSNLAIPVSAGERIHGHMLSTAAVVCTAHVYIYVNDGSPAELRRRR